MYNPIVLDHFQNPRNLSEIPNATLVGMGANPICGDVMTLYLDVKDGKISKATFKTLGCGAAIASGSILTEMLKGKTLLEANTIVPQTLVEALGGLPKIKLHCPELAVEALKNALKVQEGKN
ncbi:MAG: Iron-sulfur cluster assembly scaffold protein IscU [Elusimicrobia bacterium]|nr:Iron-sulfur cluster assembly scaffold protein IscU [Elusimicrobiota bacterium]